MTAARIHTSDRLAMVRTAPIAPFGHRQFIDIPRANRRPSLREEEKRK